MREILFRGKRADNGEWVYGHYIKKRDPLLTGVEYHFIVTQDMGDSGLLLSYVSWNKVIPETVGQYTGLLDKNGKKIFEGDIIRNLKTKETAVVQWFPEHSAFMVWCKSSNEVGFLYECAKSNIEVIGNIHDNPELLEVSK